jgi:DNA topoisomerase-2
MSSVSLTNSVYDASANLAKQYQKKTDQEHILSNPEAYIGSTQNIDANTWAFHEETGTVRLQQLEVNMGLYKLFDEAVVNSRDHIERMLKCTAENKKSVSYIDVTISGDGTITVSNDGNGIDIAKHPEYKIWIPQMIFGELRTSTNYDVSEDRTIGGKNGFGIKLAFVWSTWGSIETVDHTRGLKYYQEYSQNMTVLSTPIITKATKSEISKPYTKVSFKPDYARLELPGLSADMTSLLKKRVYDIAAVSDNSAKKVRVSFNGIPVPVKNFQHYVDLYIGTKDAVKRINDDENNARWEYTVTLSPTQQFEQISFVNGIATFKGGKHVEYFMGQLCRGLSAYIKDKKKVEVSPSSIKEQLMVFLRCDIVNPSFDSQTKEYLTTPSAKFGSSCTISKAFIEKIAKMGIMERACAISVAKEIKSSKRTDGTKTKTVRGIANFIDANLAGTAQSTDCSLYLCEGLSALAGIVGGLSPKDRDTKGIYPLKGKPLNVRGAPVKQLAENKEICDVKRIIGLESGKEYNTTEDVTRNLRYSNITIITDQDLDGSHIKGLIINIFHSEWASLLKIPGFLSFMNTPILRAKKGAQTLYFYNDGEYNTWKAATGEQALKSWTVKYFKGLGTSTSAEFKEYFEHPKIVNFVYNAETSDEIIDKLFNKKRPDDRKEWLGVYDKDAFLNTSSSEADYVDFFDKEMSHFSTYDNARSLPSGIDGYKISTRKVFFACKKRRLTSEIKVAQLSGYVSEHSAYHHGEASLNGAIVGMAQTFVGSNNMNILMPNGQFGTRLAGGDDSASERYIFTQLNPMTAFLFPENDDAILNYLNDDGTMVEPEFYLPIVPMVLLNGVSGIGTGFSCSIPAFNLTEIIRYIKSNLLAVELAEPISFVPYYEGFKGQITQIDDKKFLVKGKYEKTGEDKICITELPVGTWTLPYTTLLEGLIDGTVDKTGKKIPAVLKDMTSNSTEVNVNISIVFPKGRLAELEEQIDANGINGVEKLLKLTTTVSTTNIHLFDVNRRLKKYESIEEIIDAFYEVRMDGYRKRKAWLEQDLEQRLQKLSNRARYIQGNLDDTIDLRRKSQQQVEELLIVQHFDKIDGDYKYLIKMPMDSVTNENAAKILKERMDAEEELAVLRATTLTQMWVKELDVLSVEYDKYKGYRANLQNPSDKDKTKTKKIIKKVVKVAK